MRARARVCLFIAGTSVSVFSSFPYLQQLQYKLYHLVKVCLVFKCCGAFVLALRGKISITENSIWWTWWPQSILGLGLSPSSSLLCRNNTSNHYLHWTDHGNQEHVRITTRSLKCCWKCVKMNCIAIYIARSISFQWELCPAKIKNEQTLVGRYFFIKIIRSNNRETHNICKCCSRVISKPEFADVSSF